MERQAYDLLEKPNNSDKYPPVDPNGRERTWKWSMETVALVRDTEMGVRLDRNNSVSIYKEEWQMSGYCLIQLG